MDDDVKDFNERFEKEKDLREKRYIVEKRRLENQIDQITTSDKFLDIAKNTDFSRMHPDQIAKIREENLDYIKAAQHRSPFINSVFDKIVPFFRKNLILIGAPTGQGKSTAVANIVYRSLNVKSHVTGRLNKILVITNEERSEDVYNRITSLIKGYHYVNHSSITPEQIEVYDQYIGILSERITVIDNAFGGGVGITTTLEGIQTIFDNLIANKTHYDMIIIDYYQKISKSSKNPFMRDFDVQHHLSLMLDNYKNIYPAPIVLMAQVQKPNDENREDFQNRIKGRKSLMDSVTLAMEMAIDRKNYRTEWIVWKNRFNQGVGESVFTGYDAGRLVPWKGNKEFLKKVAEWKKQKQDAEMLGAIFKQEDEENTENTDGVS
jgi:hypothetical protein